MRALIKMMNKVFMEKKRNCLLVYECGSEEENNEMHGLEFISVCSRDVDVDSNRQKNGEEWRRSAGLIKLLITNEEVLMRVNEDRQTLNSIW